jgi:hypothetical protein
MDVDHQKTRRKISNLRSQKAGIGLSTLKEITTTLVAATQIEGKAGVEAKRYLCIACITREIQIIGQGIVPSFWSPRKK